MAKVLKGQFKNAQTISSNGEFISGREAVLALGQDSRFMPSIQGQNAVADFKAFGITVESTSEELVPYFREAPGYCPCPVCMASAKAYGVAHGNFTLSSDSDFASNFIPSTIADEGAVSVAVGGSFSGNIDFTGDTDDITVFLVAGQTYLISLRGTGPEALNDTFLQIRNPSGTLLGGSQGQDDDGGTDLNSLITLNGSTVTVTGLYTIRAASFSNPGDPGIGGYTVDVRQRPGSDAVGDTNATAAPLALGTTFGFRESTGAAPAQPPIDPLLAGDLDRYSVELVAGHFYTFKVAASADYTNAGNPFSLPTGTVDTFIYLTNAAGTIIAANDDNDFPSDLSSSLGFFAETSGTYYLNVTGYSPQTGGYVIDFEDVDFANQDPRDAFNWFSADNVDFVDVAGVPTAYVYFALPGESFGELADNGVDPLPSFGWNAREIQQVMLALEEYEHILGVNYEITTNVAEATFRLITTTSTQYGAYFYPQDPAYGTQQGIGVFNVDSGNWDKPGASQFDTPGDQVSLDQGGFAFSVILHEFGHAHGLAHPHDHGGGSDILLGVVGATGSYGLFNLNQGVYSVMSYNDAWDFHPDGPSPFTLAGLDNGWTGTLSAFDIATLQQRYGVTDYATGDDVYTLTDVVDDTYYQCIWDSGGTDSIVYGGTLNANIDLLAATIDYSPTGGGAISFVIDPAPGTSPLRGGFTIAQGAIIENATGSSGDDNLIGNNAANVLTGNGGADNLVGRGGDDTLHGGAGTDIAYYDGNRADYTITAHISGGQITGFTIVDNDIGSPADSGNPIRVADEGTDELDGVESLDFADAAFSLAGTVVVFDGDGNLVSVHTTIQAAIDDATTLDGYTVFAGSGTYAEDVNVTKELTIQGANEGVAGTDGARLAESSIKSLTISADNVTVDGVEVTGNSNSAGVFVNAGSDNFELTNSALNGTSDAYGILTGQIADLDVNHNLLAGYGIGMYVSGPDSTGTINNNLFQGGGEDVTIGGGDDGLYNGLVMETSHVTVDTNVFATMYYSSIVITPFGPDTVDLATFITNNTFPGGLAEREIFIYPTNSTHHVLGTDHNEGFDAETAQLAVVSGGYGYTSASTSFDGRGGNDYAWGGELADDYTGGTGSDQLFGNGGDDTLNGGADNDLLDGGAGIDTAEFASAGLAYTDTLAGWLIASSEGNDFVQNVEIVVSGTQRNLLVGSTGFAGIQAALDAAQDNDNVRLATGVYAGSWNYADSGLTVIAQPGAQINGTFTPSDAQGISVYGAALVDNITTGAGADILSGGGGADTLTGGAGNDTYIVDDASDQVIEGVGGGVNDAIYSSVSYTLASGQEIETLATLDWNSTAALNLTGNEIANYLIGNAGANVLDGAAGADTMQGLGGNDTYIVDNAGDRVFESIAGTGNDAIYTSVSYTLATGEEIETLATLDWGSIAAIDLTGNEIGNYMIGNAGANVLDGKGGADALQGLGGADMFAFTTALGGGNVDQIVDFLSGTDTIALDDAIFGGIGTPGSFNASAFVVGSAAADADDRIVYNQATGQLFYDADGNGAGAAVLFATLNGSPVLTASDFQVI